MIASIKHKFNRYNERRKRMKLVKNIRKSVNVLNKGKLSGDKPIVLCLYKDGEYFIESFMEHYLNLGFEEFVFIDNCSKDDSIDLLKNYDVTIVQSKLPYSKYKWAFKQFLVHDFGVNVWSLYVDIDELWEYPGLEKISLEEYFEYLNHNNYNAAAAMMLDMFADIPLKDLDSLENDDLKKIYPYFDNTSLKIIPYKKAYNTTNHKETNRFSEGVHKQFFGVDSIYLSKIPLIKWDPSISVHETSHESTFVNIADVSGLLLHYKFVKGFEKKIAKILEENNYWNSSAVYAKYAKIMAKNPSLNLKTKSSTFYKNPEQLEREKIVWIGEEYRKLMKSKCS